MPFKHNARPALYRARRVEARQQALSRRFLVAGCAVELARTVQAAYLLELQRGCKRRRVSTIILDGVSRAHDLQMLEALYGTVHFILHSLGQAGAHTLQVHFLGVQPARLHKYLVPRLFRKAHHLVLNRRTISRADALDLSAVQRAAVQVRMDNTMRLLIGEGYIAIHLIFHLALCQKGKRLDALVPGLAGEL